MRMTYTNIKDLARTALGIAAETAIPSIAREIDEGRRTGRLITLKKAIVHSRVRRAVWNGDEDAAKKAVDDWWKSEVGDDYFANMAGKPRFESLFLGPHYQLVEELSAYCKTHPEVKQLVEMGCGDGMVLNHLSSVLEGFDSFVGIDISDRITSRNKIEYAENTRIAFESGDAVKWIQDNDTSNTVLLSYGGVMEYLNEDNLLEVLAQHFQQPNAVVALSEPIDNDFNPEHECASKLIGTMHVYHCHNYAHLLRKTGFEIKFETYIDIAGWPWTMIIAAKPSADA